MSLWLKHLHTLYQTNRFHLSHALKSTSRKECAITFNMQIWFRSVCFEVIMMMCGLVFNSYLVTIRTCGSTEKLYRRKRLITGNQVRAYDNTNFKIVCKLMSNQYLLDVRKMLLCIGSSWWTLSILLFH